MDQNLKILIVRTSAMGDVVHCLPVLTALRRHLPRARIAWVVERTFAPLLGDHPDIDELIVVRLRQWRKDLASAAVRSEIVEFRRALRRFAPDVALDLMGNHKGGAIAWMSGAQRRLGAARPLRREGSSAIWINEPIDADVDARVDTEVDARVDTEVDARVDTEVDARDDAIGTHAVDRALAILAGLGLPAGGSPGEKTDFGADKILPRVPDDARAFLAARRRPFAVIQAGAGWGNKTYPPARWGEVARGLRERAELAVWVPIAPGEEHLARAVVEASDGAARAVDAQAFAYLAALLRASRLVLGGDTGPLHLAHALGTPVLCLIGPTDPARNGPYVPPDALPRGDRSADQVLFKHLPCSYCYKRYAEPKACLLNISAQEVVDRALATLDGYRIENPAPRR